MSFHCHCSFPVRKKLKIKPLCSFQTCFTVYTAHFLSGKVAFVGKKKQKTFQIAKNHTLVTRNRAGIVGLLWVFGTVSKNCKEYVTQNCVIIYILLQNLSRLRVHQKNVQMWMSLCILFAMLMHIENSVLLKVVQEKDVLTSQPKYL